MDMFLIYVTIVLSAFTLWFAIRMIFIVRLSQQHKQCVHQYLDLAHDAAHYMLMVHNRIHSKYWNYFRKEFIYEDKIVNQKFIDEIFNMGLIDLIKSPKRTLEYYFTKEELNELYEIYYKG